MICAIGGDGTVNEVVNGMAGSDGPLAVIPTGTVNVLALELGIPLDPPDACRLAAWATSSTSTWAWPATATSRSWPAPGSTPPSCRR